MLKITKKIPLKFYLACSGGVDSMSLLNLFIKGRQDFEVIHFDHGTKYGQLARKLVEETCAENEISCMTYKYPQKEASELLWSQWRNEIMQGVYFPVITAHHLNDSVESFLMRGSPISYQKGNIIRPLIRCTKKQILQYACHNKLVWLDDPSNMNSSHRRNKIRNELIPLMRECGINPINLIKGICDEN